MAYKAQFFENFSGKIESSPDELYSYKAYSGKHTISLETGDCMYLVSEDKKNAQLVRGPSQVSSSHFAVVVRGFSPPNKQTSLDGGTFLPYVNGCSTRQIFPPERPGDPTFQMLYLPPNSSEQAHHIHSTARVVYVLSGTGTSVVGMEQKFTRHELKPGMMVILDRMCPHHFETGDEPLVVLPVHIWSSIAGAEFNHPMFNGTFLTNHGER